jgi:hypothetical protein
MSDPRATALHLHAEFAAHGGVTAVFSSKVRDYVAYRPSYPQALTDFLLSRITGRMRSA